MTRHDLLTGSREDDPAYEPATVAQVELLHGVVQKLPARKRYILQERFAGRSLREIGGALGISKERVRQLEVRARRLIVAWMRRGRVAQ